MKMSTNDMKFCIRIGCERFNNNQKANVRELKYTSYRSSVDISIQGVIAEYAFTKMHNLPLDLLHNTTPNSHARDRGDALLEGKYSLDIKGPIGLHCPLRVMYAHGKKNIPHVYALCCILRPDDKERREMSLRPNQVSFSQEENIQVHFMGFSVGKEVCVEFNIGNSYNKKYYFVGQEELFTWDIIKEKLEGTYVKPKTTSFSFY
jgi:hypothetical protein